MTKSIAKPGGEGKNAMNISNDNRLISRHLHIVMWRWFVWFGKL